MRSDKNKKKKNTDTTADKPKKRRPVLRRIIEIIIGLAIVVILAVVIYSCVVIARAPEIDTENITDLLSESTVIYDADGKEIDTVYSNSDRTTVEYEDLPEDLVNAFVALEDKTFWDHHGFNFVRIAGAVVESVFTDNGISGTSTITQQLSRNLFLTDQRFERSLSRKIQEAYYAVILEKELTKEEILVAYLNTIDFGYHASGVQAASQAYFSKDVNDLTLAQCAALAPLAQSPTTYALVQYVNNEEVSPEDDNILDRTANGTFIANDLSKDRRETCLSLMKKQDYITEEEYEKAAGKDLKDILDPQFTTPVGEAAYFADYVISEVIDDLMEQKGMDYETATNALYNGGLRIHSTLDSQAQEVIEKEFENPANFPSVLLDIDGNGDVIRNGNVVMHDYSNYFNSKGQFIFQADEFRKNDDGSLVLLDGHRLNIYDTEVAGETDYSIEFKNLYTYEEGALYSISGGFINIPQEFKSRDDDGNVVIAASFIKDNPDFFIFNDNGTITLPASSYSLNQKIIQPQAAMTIVENNTGNIKAMVGGRMTTGRMLHNRAISLRQPGSSIKPLGVYTPAIAQSAEEAAAGKKHNFTDFNIDKQGDKLWGDYLTPASIVVDEKTKINGQYWPANANHANVGPVTMRRAMELSINTCAVKILMQVGADYSYNMIEKFGITTLDENDRNVAALALGGMTHGVSTLEMASAYSVFPNNGHRYDNKSYTEVLDRNGEVILSSEKAKKHEVLDDGVAWIMADMLKSVVRNSFANPASISGVQVGGKTGTTDEQNDIWFDGFTPNYSASLWIGNDQNLQLSDMSGPVASLWGKIMNQVTNAKKGSYPSAPSNVITKNGEYFINGTQSGLSKASDLEKKVKICTESGYLATPDCPHAKEEKFIMYEDDADDIPKYYCHLHNSNPLKYPIDPDEKLVVPEKPEKPSVIPEDNGTSEQENNVPNQNGNHQTDQGDDEENIPIIPDDDDDDIILPDEDDD